ncbi:precorrin-8X methylmutase [Shewanella atlantica]|uniref:Precorrin-8X methylmutase n=1 Tax=Shewanella atlantica TaxID=271099 RepID=A0A431WE38_9GAMM|nr:precorrin-8X methylmutase [Shewanella atlantica]RTR33659.1 precorrin-8X methylmutase [Shewanella atlantica]
MDPMKQITTKGRDIEASSFSIIDAEIADNYGGHEFTSAQWSVVRRAIHTSGDFEFAKLFHFSDDAIDSALQAIRSGCAIVADVSMITSGLSQRRMEQFGNRAHCFISDEDVVSRAITSGGTRAVEAMRRARDMGLLDGGIVGVGNAPTALFEVLRMVDAGEANPALIIGIPVGFVKAIESKEALVRQDKVPFIASVGRKGGSPLIVSSLHALMVEAAR